MDYELTKSRFPFNRRLQMQANDTLFQIKQKYHQSRENVHSLINHDDDEEIQAVKLNYNPFGKSPIHILPPNQTATQPNYKELLEKKKTAFLDHMYIQQEEPPLSPQDYMRRAKEIITKNEFPVDRKAAVPHHPQSSHVTPQRQSRSSTPIRSSKTRPLSPLNQRDITPLRERDTQLELLQAQLIELSGKNKKLEQQVDALHEAGDLKKLKMTKFTRQIKHQSEKIVSLEHENSLLQETFAKVTKENEELNSFIKQLNHSLEIQSLSQTTDSIQNLSLEEIFHAKKEPTKYETKTFDYNDTTQLLNYSRKSQFSRLEPIKRFRVLAKFIVCLNRLKSLGGT